MGGDVELRQWFGHSALEPLMYVKGNGGCLEGEVEFREWSRPPRNNIAPHVDGV